MVGNWCKVVDGYQCRNKRLTSNKGDLALEDIILEDGAGGNDGRRHVVVLEGVRTRRPSRRRRWVGEWRGEETSGEEKRVGNRKRGMSCPFKPGEPPGRGIESAVT